MAEFKSQAHYRWVCLPCRWSVKQHVIDPRSSREPGFVCPQCGRSMIWTGPAFRPPPKNDDDGWAAASGVLNAGERYLSTRNRRTLPKTRAELAVWLALPSPTWLPERAARVTLTTAGRVQQVRWGKHVLREWDPVQVWKQGRWLTGVLRAGQDRAADLWPSLVAPAEVVLRAGGVAEVNQLRYDGLIQIEDGTRLRMLHTPQLIRGKRTDL